MRSVRRKNVALDTIQSVAAKTGVAPSIVRHFLYISAPENSRLFSAEAARKAFGHLKDVA
jgi:hypothetical protein